jgi:hypothetical protein
MLDVTRGFVNSKSASVIRFSPLTAFQTIQLVTSRYQNISLKDLIFVWSVCDGNARNLKNACYTCFDDLVLTKLLEWLVACRSKILGTVNSTEWNILKQLKLGKGVLEEGLLTLWSSDIIDGLFRRGY